MLTITRKDLLLTINDNVIPAMGSSDVPVSFVNDTETYVGFLIEPRVGYYINGCPKSTVCEYVTSNNIIKIPAEAFKNKGLLVIAIALIDSADSNHIEVTKELALEVTPAPNGTVVLPATDTWQTAVKNLVEQLYNQDYKPQFDQIEEDLSGLVEEAQNQQNKANNQQTQIDNAIDIMGDYEIVQENPTQIRFKKGDGTYGDTVNLGDNLASKSMVNAGYDTYSGNSYSGSASDYGIEIGKASGNYKQEGTPTPESPVEPKFFEPKHVNTNGGNLFDASKIQTTTQGGATVTNNGDGSFTVSGSGDLSEAFNVSYNYTHEETIKMLKAGTIRLGGDIPSTLPRISFFINTSSGNKNVLSNNVLFGEKSSNISQETLDDPSARLYIGLYGSAKATIQAGTVKPMVYQDGDGTWYPFNADSTPLGITLRALPSGVCDTYENGVITRKVGVVTFDGSDDEEWELDTYINQENTIRFTYIMPQTSKNMYILCNNIRVRTTEEHGDYQYIFFPANATSIYINIEKTYVAERSVPLFKTWLQTNPITVWYELATPTTEQVDLPVIPSYFPFTNAWHDSEVEANDLTWHVLTAVNGKSSIRDGLGALLKDAPMTPNDNLLINSDFRSGVINQKGETSYTKGNGDWSKYYTIDGWCIQRGIQLSVNSNNITVKCTNSNEPGYLIQKFDYAGKFTFTIDVQSITGSVSFNISDGQYSKLNKGLNIITFDNSREWLSLRISEGATIIINYMKLEKGSYFTGMPAWNETEELYKCMSRFQIIYVKAHNNNLNASNRYYSCDTMFVVPMKKTPSVTIKKAYQINGTNITSSLTGTEFTVGKKNVGSIVIPTERNDTMIKFDLELDAYDY